MTSRRNFVKNLSLGVTGTLWAMDVTAKNKNFLKPENDEAFWQGVRSAFPLSHRKAYFNNGTFGPSPYRVLDVIQEQLGYFNETGEYGNTKKARKKVAEFVKAKPEEISLTHNTTEGINIVAWGVPLKAGDEVIITKQEHVGNALPWLNRAKLHGIVLKPFEPARTAEENMALIESMITSKTKVIAVPHITCTTGLVMPIKEISALGRSKGIFTSIDGAHGSGTIDLDMKDIGCDFYSTSCHKWMLGPNGTGFLYVREELLDTLQAFFVGGYSDTGWSLQADPPEMNGYVPTAHRYDYGSQNAALYAGVEECINFLMEIGMDKVEERVRGLATYLQNNLLELEDKVEMLTPTEAQSRISMIGFRPKNMDFKEFNKMSAENKFRIRIVPESGLNSVRISTHIYNSIEEIDRFVAMVKES